MASIERARLKSLLAAVAAWPAAAMALSGCAGVPRGNASSSSVPHSGRLVVHEAFASRHVQPRRVAVWLPPGYDDSAEPQAVLYMQDGQNLFDPATAYGGQSWEVDRHLAALQAAGEVRPAMVVGIWNTPLRSREYAPAAPILALPEPLRDRVLGGDSPLSDQYLRFLVEELKPFIDARYRTRPDRANTLLMGSSMGSLISLYALASCPEVFGAAACLSTHWPITLDPQLLSPAGAAERDEIAAAFYAWLERHLPLAGSHRLYFDRGTLHLDALYGPYQAKIDRLLAARGYRDGGDWLSRVFAGADHDEASWRRRLDIPLRFLLQA